MDDIRLKFGAEKLPTLLATGIGLVCSILIGTMVADKPVVTIIVILAIFGCVAWAISARDRWWVVMPMAGALGGYFYFGHKIFTNEVALLACLIPLAMARAIRAQGFLQDKARYLPTAIYLLTGYLLIHWLGSCLHSRFNGTAGYGNIGRAYLGAIGALIFILLFKSYGSTKYIPLALFLTYLAALFRVVVGIIIYFTKSFAYLPVINYVLPGSTHSGGDDLRVSGFTLLSLSLCYLLMKQGRLQRTFQILMIMGSCYAIALGSGRTIIVLAAAMLLFAAALYRKIVPFALAVISVTALLFTVNFSPRVLGTFSPRVQRTFSILLLNRDEAAYYGRAESSDEWHERLRAEGLAKWSQSWNTVLFGTGVEPIGEQFLAFIPGQTSEEDILQSASKVGAYESGWWTVLAVTGITGFVLYLSILIFLLRRLFPALIKDRVRDHAHALAFLAVFGIINWVLLGWSNGSFPATELMFGFLAYFALSEQSKQRHVIRVSHESGRTR